jgi:hypothetical protein
MDAELAAAFRKLQWRLDFLIASNSATLLMEGEIMAQLDDLKAQVTKNTEVEASAVVLIQGIAQKLKDAIAAGDPAALTQLATDLNASATSLADAVAANTTP